MLDVFTKVVLTGALVFTFAWVVLAQRRTIKLLSDAYLRLTHFQRVLVALAVIVCTVYAQKPSTNDVEGVTGTNQVEIVDGCDTNEVGGIVLNAPQPMSNGASILGGCGPLGTTGPTVAVRPYRLESVSTNEGYSYVMPADGTIRGTWHLSGAYEDVQKIGLESLGGLGGSCFRFPLGSDLCTSLWTYTWGKVRPQLKNASNEIAAVGAPMSAIPEVSRFWTAATSNDTYLLTWENFAVGRVPSTNYQLLSAQVELMRNGDFITRSNDVESVWRRRMPCDLDEDGWIDLVDPDPVVYDEDGFGPHQTLPEGDNTNYYYWVDLVVDRANARVTFEGDDFSTLPDPDFIARAGETNRVMLLIGKTYVVRCDLPIRCVGKEDDEVCVWSEGYSLGILWPIYLEFVPSEPLLLLAGPLLGAPSNDGGDTGVSVHPERAGGGSFSWENDFCCCSTSWDGSPIFCCDGTCGCGGCYTGDITYLIGGHGLIFGGWYCACSPDPDDPHEGDEPPDGPLAGPCVSATFSADVVIFEDEYENMPGQTIPRRSTETEVEFYAYGGTNGGTYAFSMVNESKLRRLGGAYLPKTGTIRAGESFRIKVRYEALSASGSEGDIKAKAEFTEFETNRKLPDVQTPLTSVQVYIFSANEAVENRSRSRRTYGIAEVVNCSCIPSLSRANWSAVDAGMFYASDLYSCPYYETNCRLRLTIGNVHEDFEISVIEPHGVMCQNASMIDYSTPKGTAGYFGLALRGITLLPRTVYFGNIFVEEIPTEEGARTGYFANPFFSDCWSHSYAQGAGIWIGVDGNNELDTVDQATCGAVPPPWSSGGMVWPIPMGFHVEQAALGTPPIGEIDANVSSVYTVMPSGSVILSKLGHWISRSTNDVIVVDGVVVKGEE